MQGEDSYAKKREIYKEQKKGKLAGQKAQRAEESVASIFSAEIHLKKSWRNKKEGGSGFRYSEKEEEAIRGQRERFRQIQRTPISLELEEKGKKYR